MKSDDEVAILKLSKKTFQFVYIQVLNRFSSSQNKQIVRVKSTLVKSMYGSDWVKKLLLLVNTRASVRDANKFA